MTVPAVAVKLAVVAAAATVTEAGTVSAALLLDNATEEPLVGAALDKVTVQVEEPPEATVFGEHASVVTVATGETVTEAVAELPSKEAVRVTAVDVVTVPAVAVRVAVVAAAATVTEAGTVRAALLLDNATEDPPVGAAWDKVTVQVDEPPEVTVFGEQAKVVTVVFGDTVTEAVAELPFKEAVNVTAVDVVAVPALAVNVAVVAPAATVTDAGTVSAALLLDKATEAEADGAMESPTVQVDVAPDSTELGRHCSVETVGATLMTPPLPVSARNVPSEAAATVLPIVRVSEDCVLDGDTVAVTTATTPLAIVLAFMPLAKHVTDPVPEEQVRVFPEDDKAGPAVRLNALMAAAGYAIVH